MLQQSDTSFVGRIGADLGIHMRLRQDEYGRIRGVYSYEKDGVDVQLQGRPEADNRFEILELDVRGEVLGRFTGTITPDGKMEGIWFNENRSRSFPFIADIENQR